MIYVALENLRSLYNIGAIFRTCSFFGVSGILLVGYSGKVTSHDGKSRLHDKVLKTSLGSELDLDIKFVANTEELLKFRDAERLKLIAVEQSTEAVAINTVNKDYFDNSILVFGNEVTGVSKELLGIADSVIKISKLGSHNSLNVTTAVGIVLYHVSTHTSIPS